jgi:hypothetical protein
MYSLQQLFSKNPDLPDGLLQLDIYHPLHLWTEAETIGLSIICSRFKVQHIRLLASYDTSNGNLLSYEGTGKEYARMPCLKSIFIEGFIIIWPIMFSMLSHSRVKKVVFELPARTEDPQFMVFQMLNNLRVDKCLDTNFSICDISINHREKDYYIISPYGEDIRNILMRNRRSIRCQSVIITLLALRKRKDTTLNAKLTRDCMNIIAIEIWKTRRSYLWNSYVFQ